MSLPVTVMDLCGIDAGRDCRASLEHERPRNLQLAEERGHARIAGQDVLRRCAFELSSPGDDTQDVAWNEGTDVKRGQPISQGERHLTE